MTSKVLFSAKTLRKFQITKLQMFFENFNKFGIASIFNSEIEKHGWNFITMNATLRDNQAIIISTIGESTKKKKEMVTDKSKMKNEKISNETYSCSSHVPWQGDISCTSRPYKFKLMWTSPFSL